METSVSNTVIRNWRLDVEAGYLARVGESSEKSTWAARHATMGKEAEVDDCGWVAGVRIFTCVVTMMVTTFVWPIVMVVLLPWPYARVRQGNVYGHVTGRLLMWILGNLIKIEGAEYSNTKAVYISNHASLLVIFLIMWLTPTGTVGIAKKEILSLLIAMKMLVEPVDRKYKGRDLLPGEEGRKHCVKTIDKKSLPCYMLTAAVGIVPIFAYQTKSFELRSKNSGRNQFKFHFFVEANISPME